MPRRKRIRGVKDLTDYLELQGQLAKGQGLTKLEITSENEFQDDFLESVSVGMIQPLGRKPGRELSIDDESMLYSVKQAFDAGILNRLSQRQRECFTDVVISGDTFDDVALRYNITKSAVQIYVRRAAVHIRKFIEDRDGR
jgi:DNA-directed RNA polymerase specialized sigma24 family protein